MVILTRDSKPISFGTGCNGRVKWFALSFSYYILIFNTVYRVRNGHSARTGRPYTAHTDLSELKPCGHSTTCDRSSSGIAAERMSEMRRPIHAELPV